MYSFGTEDALPERLANARFNHAIIFINAVT